MTNNEWCDVLCHHGIFGQKWGRRNGPPYPLKPSKHSAREKRLGWRKSLNNDGKEEEKKPKFGRHPDSKYFDSRKFGEQDLDRLTNRFRSEKAFNDALADKLRSENMFDQEKYRNMSRRQKKELYQKISEMETEAAYNRAYQQQIQSQIDIITSQKRLAELQRKPPTKMQQAKKAVGNMLVNMGKSSVERVGSEAMTYMLGSSINKLTGQDIVNVNRPKEDLAMKELKRKTDQLNADLNYQRAKQNLDNFNKQSQYKAAKDKADYYNNLKKAQDYRNQIMRNANAGRNYNNAGSGSNSNATVNGVPLATLNKKRAKHGLPPLTI